MKEFSNKTPYLAPQLTVVEFQVERGFAVSVDEVEFGAKGRVIGDYAIFGAMQGQSNLYMGDQMNGSYFGESYFTTGDEGEGSGYF